MQGTLLLPRRHADAFLSEDALQVSAAGISLRASSSRKTAAAASEQPEFELLDTGIFDDDRYFDVFVEYAKAAPDDILMRVTVHNRGPEAADTARAAATLVSQHLVVDKASRNCRAAMAVGRRRPAVMAVHAKLGEFDFRAEGDADAAVLRQRNQCARLFGVNGAPAISRTPSTISWSMAGRMRSIPEQTGTKAAAHYG